MPIKRFNLGLVALTFIGVFACGEEGTTPDSNTQVTQQTPLRWCVWGWPVTFEDDNALEYTSNWMGCKEHCDWLPGIPPMTLGVNRRSFSGKMY